MILLFDCYCSIEWVKFSYRISYDQLSYEMWLFSIKIYKIKVDAISQSSIFNPFDLHIMYIVMLESLDQCIFSHS